MKNFLQFGFTSICATLIAACAHQESLKPAVDTSKELSREAAETKKFTLTDFDELVANVEKDPVFEACKPLMLIEKMASRPPAAESSEEFQTRVKQFAESYITRPTSVYVYRVPEYRDFALWSLQKGDDYYLHPEYKTRAQNAVDGLTAALPKVRRQDLYSYYSLMLGRIGLAKPAYFKSTDFKTNCAYLEKSFNQDEKNPKSAKKPKELAMWMNKILIKQHLTSDKIDFDPNLQSQAIVTAGEKDVGYKETVHTKLLRKRFSQHNL